DRVLAGPQQRNRAIDAAAHRHGHTARPRLGAEALRERVGKRVPRELVTADGRGLEQAQPVERALETFGLRADDLLSLDGQTHKRPTPVACRISDDLDHQAQASGETGGAKSPRLVSSLPMRRGPGRTSTSQVGAASSVGASLWSNDSSLSLGVGST